MDGSSTQRGPCPRITFAPDFLSRVERFTARFAAARGRAQEFGPRRGSALGHDFVGYRAYHAFDDPRRIDWSLFARTDRAFVRLSRSDAGERVRIELDVSASMSAGPPGKLQRAAECAVAFAVLALRERASVEVVLTPGPTPERTMALDRPPRVRDLLRLLDGVEAAGHGRVPSSRRPVVDRRFVLSDFFGREPGEFVTRTPTTLVRILAPHELGIDHDGPVEWFDPESGERLALEVDPATRGRYTRELEHELARWDAHAAAFARTAHAVHASTDAFEDIVRRSLQR